MCTSGPSWSRLMQFCHKYEKNPGKGDHWIHTLKLQRDIDRLGNWARKWGMRFQPVKCNMMQLTHLNKIQASYTLEGTVLENVDNIKYLGVTITNDLKWNTHISNICTKANRTLGFLRRTLFSCPQNVKEAADKGMVRPILEYGSSIWDPILISFKKNWKRFKIVRQGLSPEIMFMKLGV